MHETENPEDNQETNNPEASMVFADEELFGPRAASMMEFTYLINSIMDYYTTDEAPEGEEWKREAQVTKNRIPKEVDQEVSKAFVSQLRKFQE